MTVTFLVYFQNFHIGMVSFYGGKLPFYIIQSDASLLNCISNRTVLSLSLYIEKIHSLPLIVNNTKSMTCSNC